MSKDNIIFGLGGMVLGLLIGFFGTNSLNRSQMNQVLSPAAGKAAAGGVQELPGGGQQLPPGHPDISAATGGGMQPEVQEAIKKAKENPGDFDAQLKAARFYYQVQMLDNATEYLLRANKAKPDNYEVITGLGNVYFDSGKYDKAEEWYQKALKIQPNDLSVRTDLGLSYFYRQPQETDKAISEYRKVLAIDAKHEPSLQNLTAAMIAKRDSKGAQEALNRLIAANPQNQQIAKFKTDIAELK